MEHKWIIWLKGCWPHVVGIGIASTFFLLTVWVLTKGLPVYIPVLAIIVALGYTLLAAKRDKQIDLTSGIGEKLTELDQVTTTLRELIDFVKHQKEMIRREGKAIQELSKEKADLEPVVKQSRAVIDKMFELQAKRSRRHRIVSLIIGFFLGIASSAIAAIIVQSAK